MHRLASQSACPKTKKIIALPKSTTDANEAKTLGAIAQASVVLPVDERATSTKFPFSFFRG